MRHNKLANDILDDLEKKGKLKRSKYQFPSSRPLKYKLKDILLDKVENKYYLSEKLVEKVKQTQDFSNRIAPDKNGPNRLYNIYGEDKGTGYAGNVWDKNCVSPTLTTSQGGNRQPMIEENDGK